MKQHLVEARTCAEMVCTVPVAGIFLVSQEGGREAQTYPRTASSTQARSSLLRETLVLEAGNRSRAHPRPIYWSQDIVAGDFDGMTVLNHKLQHGARMTLGIDGYLKTSSLSPSTRLNSPAFAVTKVAPKLRACAAMSRSSGPMGVPAVSKAARMSA